MILRDRGRKDITREQTSVMRRLCLNRRGLASSQVERDYFEYAAGSSIVWPRRG